MDARQYSHIARSSALVALFATRPESDSIPGLPETLALFATQLDLVETLVQRQAQPLDIVLHGRDETFTAMKIATLTMAGKVSAFAVRTHRDGLALNVRVKGNALDRLRFVERVRSCQRIHDAVAEELTAVAASGVTPALLGDLQTKIDAARSFLTVPRATVVDKSAATVQIAEAVRELNAILTKQIEPLVAPCEYTHREFFLKFCAARKAIAPRGAAATDTAAATEETVLDNAGAASVADAREVASVPDKTATPTIADKPAAPFATAAQEPVKPTASEVSPPLAALHKRDRTRLT